MTTSEQQRPASVKTKACRRRKTGLNGYSAVVLGFLFLIGFWSLGSAAATELPTARGTVFEDLNGNGRLDPGEPGIAGVLVSNGEDVVKTDAEGRYALPIDDDTIVFVIQPPGWQVPVNPSNLPQHYVIHKPAGSPPLKYAGVPPTGPLPEAIDFPLHRCGGSDGFSILVFGDTQSRNLRELDYLARDIVRELADCRDAAFGLALGDITFDDLDLFEPTARLLSLIGVPWHNIIGNHDMNVDAADDAFADETYQRVYGPSTYAFSRERVHFLVLNNIILHPAAGDEPARYSAGLRPRQKSFIRNFLSHVPSEDLVVMAMHINFRNDGDAYESGFQKDLMELLAGHPRSLSLSAHSHMQQHLFFGPGTPGWAHDRPHHHFNAGTTCGSWWRGLQGETGIPHAMMWDGTPNGYLWIHFDGPDYIIDFKAAGRSPNHQMNIHSPAEISRGSEEPALLSVNFFKGSERCTVEFSNKKDPEWHRMDKVEAHDPYYLDLVKRWERLDLIGFEKTWKDHPDLQGVEPPGRRVPGAAASRHLWQAEIPADWPAGFHAVEVRATDMHGRIYTDIHIVHIVD